MLSSTERAVIRAEMAVLLPDLCSLERNETTSDGAGGLSDEWTPVATNQPCRLGPLGNYPEEREIAARLTDTTLASLVFPANTDVRARDRATVAGRTFEIIHVTAYPSELLRRTVCREAR